MANSSRTISHDQPARISGAILGILVFLAGVALVYSVFVLARGLFDAPPPLIPANILPTPTPAATPATVAGVKAASGAVAAAAPAATVVIGQALSLFIEKLLVLLVMCIAGSVIASQGIHLFFKALAAPRSVHTDSTPPPAP